MTTRFCEHCGVPRLADARFCVECGTPLGGSAPARRARLTAARWAPALVIAAVAVVGGAAVWSGTFSARPPAFVPPRDAGNQPAELPQGHPPVTLPDDVRLRIDQMAAEAAAKPTDAKLWGQLGLVQYRASQIDPSYLDQAAKSFDHVLAQEPANADALQALGNIAFDRNQAAEAIGYYQRYLKERPDDPYVRTNLGTMYLASRRAPAAVREYEHALRLDPTFFQAQFSLAVAYRAAGNGDQAADALQKARGLAPDEATRAQMESIFQRLSAAATAPGSAAAPPAPAGESFQSDVEGVFRSHPIVGPKLDRIDWPDGRTAKVFLREFPMDEMPEFARQKLVERIKTAVQDGKTRYRIVETVRVELIDSGGGRVMETVTN